MPNSNDTPVEITKFKVSIVMVFRDHAGNPCVPVLHRKGKHGSHDTWWELPGGKRDPVLGGGIESIERAALREIYEELGVYITPEEFQKTCLRALFAESIVLPKTKHTLGQFVLVNAPKGKIPYNREPEEHDKMELVSPTEAVQRAGRRMTQEVQEFLLRLK